MFCLSLRFSQGTSLGYYLDLTSIESGFNGELVPYEEYSWVSWFDLHDAYYFFEIFGWIYVDMPEPTDANGNGFDDFFEVSQAVSTTTYGQYIDYYEIAGGTVTAQWNRSAGSPTGTCVLSLDDETYGHLGDFSHTFQVFEYTGPVTYSPGLISVTGRVDLVRTGYPGARFGGGVLFVKNATNRFDLLELQAGAWTNALGQTLSYFKNLFYRDADWPTNYYGYFEFQDGDPSTAGDDYYLWVLSIDDMNDSDGDGIPDFSDDPVVLPPRRPVLQLTRGTTNLLVQISGDVGRLHQILEATSIPATTWTTNRSLVLTNDPQTVSLPIPPSPRFWRVRAF